MTTDVNVWMITMEITVSNKMTATLATIVPMGQHVLMEAMSTYVTVLMVTMETILRNKMTVTPVTIVRMEELVLIKMATTLAAANHLDLEFAANVLKNDTQFKKVAGETYSNNTPYCNSMPLHFLSVQIFPTLTNIN